MLYRKSISAVLLGLIFLSFFEALCASAWMFPEHYDWRYRVISNLLSPRDNPAHHWLALCGIGFAALLMLPFAAYLHRYLKRASPRATRVTGAAFIAGSVALICASLVVLQHAQTVFGIRRLHEFLGRSSAAFVGDADPQFAASFCVLAPWVLGMDRRSGGIRVSLRHGCLNLPGSVIDANKR
jgi:Protein of unknown function (DUF998)